MMIWGIIPIAAVVGITVAAVCKKSSSVYRNCPAKQNPFEGKTVRFVQDDQDPINADGVRGHLETVGISCHVSSFYEKYVKRGFDIILSLSALALLSPLFLLLILAVFLDGGRPIFFSQRRVGKNKRFFTLHKFRSMKTSTPHDVPTHMLEHPDRFTTSVGRIIRKLSLDELPQLWDILIGNMSIVGPRPALWNQDVLISCRDAYGANDVLPGLTGWAQVHGRDELGIYEKARFDGAYCKNLTFKMDLTCILMTISSVLRRKGIIESGTGTLAKHIAKRNQEISKTNNTTGKDTAK